jgi:hypothetical protein
VISVAHQSSGYLTDARILKIGGTHGSL